jgi:hypothetical protein
MPKKVILEKYKKNEILTTSGFLFLFTIYTYKKNKKRHMRPWAFGYIGDI